MSLNKASYIYGSHLFFFRNGDTVASSFTTASRARASNVATIVTSAAHGLFTGATVDISGLSGTGYNQTGVTITVVNSTTFTFANTGSNESTTADTGGTVLLSGTASASFRPGANDSSWIALGICEECSDSREIGNEIEIYGPSPGKLVLQDIIENKQKLIIKFTLSEWSAFVNEVLYLTESLNSSSSQFNPLEGEPKKGWLKIQRYDQDNDQRLVLDLWGKLKISGDVQFGGSDIVKPQLEFTVLHSTLNTGTL